MEARARENADGSISTSSGEVPFQGKSYSWVPRGMTDEQYRERVLETGEARAFNTFDDYTTARMDPKYNQDPLYRALVDCGLLLMSEGEDGHTQFTNDGNEIRMNPEGPTLYNPKTPQTDSQGGVTSVFISMDEQ